MKTKDDQSCLLEEFLSSDLTWKVIQYLNVLESGRLASVSQKYYYLVHQYRRWIGPEIKIASGSRCSLYTPGEVIGANAMASSLIRDMQSKLRTKPNFVLGFATPQPIDSLGAISSKLSLPPNNNNNNNNTAHHGKATIGLMAVAHQAIQVCHPTEGVNSIDQASLMGMTFPGATILPYCIQGRPKEADLSFLAQRLSYHNPTQSSSFWKAVILYAVGDGVENSDKVTTRMQAMMPDAVVVGGVCHSGFVSVPTFERDELESMSVSQLQYARKKCCWNLVRGGELDPYTKPKIVEKSDLIDHVWSLLQREEGWTAESDASMYQVSGSGIFGVFLGGNLPMKSVVSRGVLSVLNRNGPPRSFSNLVVEEASLIKPGDDEYIFGGAVDNPPIHLIRSVRDKGNGGVYSPMQLTMKYGLAGQQIDFLGFKREKHDGFQLADMNNLMQAVNAFVVLTDGSDAEMESLQGAELDFFSLDGDACLDDMERTMKRLRMQTEGEEILGALMYTCNGRGPEAGYPICEDMADARRFAKAFPTVPCLGFYAAGEYGPVALAGNENVFQSGRATLQGYTAVFALFIVPKRDTQPFYNLDDSLENVQRFVRQQLN